MSNEIVLNEIGGCEDTLTVTERNGHFNVICDEPWAGDTETGFGNETSIALNREQAKELADWIYSRLGGAE